MEIPKERDDPMKKVFLILIVLLLIFVIVPHDKATPLDKSEVELFKPYYSFDKYSIYKRIDIDPLRSFFLSAAIVGIRDDETCHIGHEDDYLYIIKYKNKYYNFIDANKTQIYSCDDLRKVGIV